jgi:GT2 family glycosyltransferase
MPVCLMQNINDPLVTILVPTYHRAHMLCDAVVSALGQTYRSIEVVVLDDASPDDTAEKLAPFHADPRFRYIRHERNLGIAGNWHHGITVARGEYFCLLHDDDTFEPTFVKSLLQPLLDDPALAMTFCDHRMMDQEGNRLPADPNTRHFRRDRLAGGRLSQEAFAQAVLVDFSVPVGASLFRRQAMGPDFIDERAKGAIDYWLLYRILKTGGDAYYVNQRLMNYRAHEGGMSSQAPLQMAEGHIFRFDAALSDPMFAAFHRQMADLQRKILIRYGLDLTQVGRRVEARQALRKVLRERSSLRAWIAFLLACSGQPGSWLIRQLRADRGLAALRV